MAASPSSQSDASAENNGGASGPRRSGLVQERSRQTRQRLVRAAIDLWTERGFEEGIEATTVEEIVAAAGVTKGTFYFHFAHKEDILLEFGWGTSEAMLKEATTALARERTCEATFNELFDALARRISKTPRPAVARTLEEFHRRPGRSSNPSGERLGFLGAYAVVLSHAQETGELPASIDAHDLAEMLQWCTMGSIQRWIADESVDLAATMRSCTAMLLAGAREVGRTSSRVG